MADQMKPTPRSTILGLFSDVVNLPLEYMSSPERTQQMQGAAQFLYGTGIPKTLERMSYGDSLFTGSGMTLRPREETINAAMNVAPFAPAVGRVAGRMIKATEGLPVGMSIKPINLNKGIYKPELTMEEMLKVKDIPTVDRVRQSIDLVGEKEFEKMVNAQYKKYKPSDVDQEAMLVESVTLNILGKAQRSPYPQQAALDLAQQRAGLPSPQSLTMPSVPTVEQMGKYGRTEVVPLSQAVSFQSARNWENFNAGKHPGDLVAGYGDKPLALRLETGEYVIYDGNHRTDLALQKGQTELPMYVIDVKSYDPTHAGRKPVPPSMTDDELLSSLLGDGVNAPPQTPTPIESPAYTDPFGNTIGSSIR